ncbi:hypothetical protein [Sphingobacterium mizutaii]|nr:hypothetical protein [Sphingobacterium mizutaii]
MFYQPDVDDENARMDAEQDAKLERAMADREDDQEEPYVDPFDSDYIPF